MPHSHPNQLHNFMIALWSLVVCAVTVSTMVNGLQVTMYNDSVCSVPLSSLSFVAPSVNYTSNRGLCLNATSFQGSLDVQSLVVQCSLKANPLNNTVDVFVGGFDVSNCPISGNNPFIWSMLMYPSDVQNQCTQMMFQTNISTQYIYAVVSCSSQQTNLASSNQPNLIVYSFTALSTALLIMIFFGISI